MIPRFVKHRERNNLVLVITLSSHKNDGYLLDISKLGHLGIVIVDGIERSLIFQTGAGRFISIGSVCISDLALALSSLQD